MLINVVFDTARNWHTRSLINIWNIEARLFSNLGEPNKEHIFRGQLVYQPVSYDVKKGPNNSLYIIKKNEGFVTSPNGPFCRDQYNENDDFRLSIIIDSDNGGTWMIVEDKAHNEIQREKLVFNGDFLTSDTNYVGVSDVGDVERNFCVAYFHPHDGAGVPEQIRRIPG